MSKLKESNSNFILVDSSWNKTTINAGKFMVSGHPRYLISENGIKVVHIKEYIKNGYTRRAKKGRTE